MSQAFFYLEQIKELIHSNGWDGQFDIEVIEESAEAQTIRIRLSERHPTAPCEIVNDYREGMNPLEQVQQECLRALRTGRPGV